MTRKQLRYVLENVVHLDPHFKIYTCGETDASIKVALDKKCLDSNNKTLLEYNLNGLSINSIRSIREKLNRIHDIVKENMALLRKAGFTVTNTYSDTIEFKFPKKYIVKEEKTYFKIIEEMENPLKYNTSLKSWY